MDAVISLALYQYPQPQDLTSFSRRSKGKSSGFNLEKKKKCLLEKHFVEKKYLVPKNIFCLNLATWNFTK